MEIETHPFEPFLPGNAKVLFLGTFPAKPVRWSMHFYYPNFLNDFWRVMGLLFFSNATYFEIRDGKNRWNEEVIRQFCASEGLAFSDTAEKIRRLKGNASDASLDIVKARDIEALLAKLPKCKTIVTTGVLASEVLADQFGCEIPAVGECTQIVFQRLGRIIAFYRMPSTSRAYPLPLEQKAAIYKRLFQNKTPISSRGSSRPSW